MRVPGREHGSAHHQIKHRQWALQQWKGVWAQRPQRDPSIPDPPPPPPPIGAHGPYWAAWVPHSFPLLGHTGQRSPFALFGHLDPKSCLALRSFLTASKKSRRNCIRISCWCSARDFLFACHFRCWVGYDGPTTFITLLRGAGLSSRPAQDGVCTRNRQCLKTLGLATFMGFGQHSSHLVCHTAHCTLGLHSDHLLSCHGRPSGPFIGSLLHSLGAGPPQPY